MQGEGFIKNEKGDALIEAVILFPFMIMIFAALVLLAVYLPTRAALQRATQFAATAIATERSDTWLFFDSDDMEYRWETDKNNLTNVYVALFTGAGDVDDRAKAIVANIEGNGISSKAGVLSVKGDIVNKFIYKEVVVEAQREFTPPVKLGYIGFPETIVVKVTSTAVVVNGDEFVRNMDIAVDFVDFLVEKFKLTNITEAISSFGSQVSKFMGWGS